MCIQEKLLVASLCTAALVDAGCPHAKLWMKHGPEKAAEILAARNPSVKSFRKLEDTTVPTGYGTCSYENPFSSTQDCVQLVGKGFNDQTAKAMCDKAMMGMAVGVLEKGAVCQTTSMLAGYCFSKEDGDLTESMPMSMGGMMMGTCDAVRNGCETFARGRWVNAGACADGTAKTVDIGALEATQETVTIPLKDKCTIAPGPMGAAHQHARSPGYQSDCADAPAKNSEWQWPLMWTAQYESESLPVRRGKHADTADTKEPHRSWGRVYYDLSRNWKRLDSTTTGQLFGGDFSDTDQAEDQGFGDMMTGESTMLHRGTDMMFIKTMKNGTKTCRKMNMGVIGNIRPDWFMDNRGAQTSTQYMGNQHIFHRGKPTLVKQWRKKDFADMYFVMSILADVGEDGVHWPVQRNDPGEGFGDDNLHSYFNHSLLSENDKDIFLVDEGLDCVVVSGSDTDGPPAIEEEKPSNLNVDEAGWFELEFTMSPDGVTLDEAMETAINEISDCADTPATTFPTATSVSLGKKGQLTMCLNDDGTLSGRATFETSDPVWVAVGLRPDERPEHCEMYPADIVLTEEMSGKWGVEAGEIKKTLKVFTAAEDVINKGFVNTQTLSPSVVREGTTTTLEWTRAWTYNEDSTNLKLTWATGREGTFGYHSDRGCAKLPTSTLLPCTSTGAVPTATNAQIPAASTHNCAAKEDMDAGFSSVEEQLAALSAKLDLLNTPTPTANEPQGCSKFKSRSICNSDAECDWSEGKCAPKPKGNDWSSFFAGTQA